jgi:predicted nucleotidyltransferase
MKIGAVICEYNPFHNGHAHQIAEMRKRGFDYILCLMSGNFVQRGAPACRDKWQRTCWALQAGADAVLELPAAYALQSAEGFAHGAVRILNSLGVVHSVCFGCELPDVGLLKQIASLLLKEPLSYRRHLKEQLDQGLSYAFARSHALVRALPLKDASLLAMPNIILGIEYTKALLKLNSRITPLPIQRISPQADIASASHIRAQLLTQSIDSVRRYMPDYVARTLTPFVTEDALSQAVLTILRRCALSDIAELPDVTEGLQYRIKEASGRVNTLHGLYHAAKSARYPQTRIQRICMYALLDIKKDDLTRFNAGSAYARLLGFRKNSAALLKEIKQNSAIPFITKAAHYKKHGDIADLFALDMRATDIYSLYTPRHQSGRDLTEKIIFS